MITRNLAIIFVSILVVICALTVDAQDTVTGAFEGIVTDSQTGNPIAGAFAQIINQQTNLVIPKRTDSRGRFYQGLLNPGMYTIRVSAPGFQTKEVMQRLFITRTGEVVPVPVSLEPVTTSARPSSVLTGEDTDIRARINAIDARRDGSFTEEEVSVLPLGAGSLVRTFDELAFLLPGVAPPPQTLGGVAGPGVGPGIGSAGQFAVNGLRSRGNNFTVDGSDNNDEDIGVRRQGFLALIPQTIESVKEYQVITLLAPAQFGRNLGAQVNAVSKSGGSNFHGTFYGRFNSRQLNARDFFDANDSTAITQLRAGNDQPVVLRDAALQFGYTTLVFPHNPVIREQPLTVRGPGRQSLTLGQGGIALGGPLARNRMFFFASAEGQFLNATKKKDFVVPTVEQRGIFSSGATGLLRDGLTGDSFVGQRVDRIFIDQFIAGGISGNPVLSFFPFPNNPAGVFGANTFTQVLPASGRGQIALGKFDYNFKFRQRPQSFTSRYNFTNDWRDIPTVGEALFSTVKSRVRTQNLSSFLNSEVTGSSSNQLRLSYGRTRLNFDDRRDDAFLLPIGRTSVRQCFGNSCSDNPTPITEDASFLLNATLLSNITLPAFSPPNAAGLVTLTGPNTGPVVFARLQVPGTINFRDETTLRQSPSPFLTVEESLGAIGQIIIAGFSPVGVDVFNFPQRRVNNTYQAADILTKRSGDHTISFGADIRRTELNSDLPRNSRTLLTFYGIPRVECHPTPCHFLNASGSIEPFVRPIDAAVAGAASNSFQTLATGDNLRSINLRFYQFDFFGQDVWRIGPHFSLSYGLRYEYNTPVREVNRRIEQAFKSPLLSQVPNLSQFLEDRTRIFDPDLNNFAPRLSVAYAPNIFGTERVTIIRAGYGIFYDQNLGAVVSQSRNVYPNFLTFGFTGGVASFTNGAPITAINPRERLRQFLLPGALNTLRSNVTLNDILTLLNVNNPRIPPRFSRSIPQAVDNFLTFTIAARKLETPVAQHFNVTFEQELSKNLLLSAAYVGTRGRNLLRFTTPNLGANAYPVADFFTFFTGPGFNGTALPPGSRFTNNSRRILTGIGFSELTGGRPVSGVGTVFRYETTASSRYDSLQMQLRGRFGRAWQFQAEYTFAKATDDVSDVFDLAGAYVLPQNSITFAGERGPANFDVRHRVTYSLIYEFPELGKRHAALRYIFANLQVASIGQFQTGQPFTVNSLFDINLDGNVTDRLKTADGVVITGDRRQPLRLTATNTFTLLAPLGEDGKIGRNSFHAGGVYSVDLSLLKRIVINSRQRLTLRLDTFNLTNRSNFGIPVRFLEADGFGKATQTITPSRQVVFALNYSF